MLLSEAHAWKLVLQERKTLPSWSKPLSAQCLWRHLPLCYAKSGDLSIQPQPLTCAASAKQQVLVSTSENLSHHRSSALSVEQMLGNRRKNEQRFPNLPFHLFCPSVGVIKKQNTVNHTCTKGSFRPRTFQTFMLQKKSYNTVNEKELLASLFPTKLHKSEQNIK